MPDPREYKLDYRPRDYSRSADKPAPEDSMMTSSHPESFWEFLARVESTGGTAYLPHFLEGEVEIARVTYNSRIPSITSIRAVGVQSGIRYRVVDSSHAKYPLITDTSAEPLAMRELIALMDGVQVEENGPGLTNMFRDGLAGGDLSPEDIRKFITVTSDFYPELGRWYEDEAREWVPPPPSDVDAGDQDLGLAAQMTDDQLAATFPNICFMLSGDALYGKYELEGLEILVGIYNEQIVPRLSPARRLDVLTDLTQQIEAGAGPAKSILPFILADPEGQIVATASLNLAVLRPLQDDDALIGPRSVLALAVSESLGPPGDETDRRRAGILCGLLLLGDRRIQDLLSGRWRGLGRAGRERLLETRSGFAFATVVDFLLDWLQEAEGSDHAAICKALQLMPEQKLAPFVLEVERKFPADAPDDRPAIREVKRWTFEAYGQVCQERFRAVLVRNGSSQALIDAMKAWGLDPTGTSDK